MQLKILIFDDEESIRHTMKSLLVVAGYAVDTFEDPTGFSRCWQDGCHCGAGSCCADVLVTDILMPHVSGFRFIEGLKAGGCKIPYVAIMSGRLTDNDRLRAERMKLQVFEKPFSMHDVRSWLELCRKKISSKRMLCSLPGAMKSVSAERRYHGLID